EIETAHNLASLERPDRNRFRSLQRPGRKAPLPEALPPKNRACDFHRTRLTHNKSVLHGSRFHHFQTKTMNALVTRWMKQDSIAKGIGAAIGSMDEMMIVPSSIDVHRVAAQPAPALLVRVQLGPLLLISHVAYHTT